MLYGFSILLFCQFIGETVTRLLGIPVPGAVLGMVLLLVWLRYRGGAPDYLVSTANGLLQVMTIMYVPASVGLIKYPMLFTMMGVKLLLICIGTTFITFWVTARLFQYLCKRQEEKQ